MEVAENGWRGKKFFSLLFFIFLDLRLLEMETWPKLKRKSIIKSVCGEILSHLYSRERNTTIIGEKIKEAVKAAAKGGGFVLSTGEAVTYNTPIENFMVLQTLFSEK